MNYKSILEQMGINVDGVSAKYQSVAERCTSVFKTATELTLDLLVGPEETLGYVRAPRGYPKTEYNSKDYSPIQTSQTGEEKDEAAESNNYES